MGRVSADAGGDRRKEWGCAQRKSGSEENVRAASLDRSRVDRGVWSVAAAVVTAFCAAGCATVTSGSSQTLTIETDPPAAACTLTRADQLIGVVNPTPGSISIEKSKKDISVTCKKDGYRDETAMLGSKFAGATLGNILLGGLIGIGVDAMSGATSKYPTSLSIQLMPNSFASVAERDEYFDKLKDHLTQQAASKRDQINKSCTSQCESKLKQLDEEEQGTLADRKSVV